MDRLAIGLLSGRLSFNRWLVCITAGTLALIASGPIVQLLWNRAAIRRNNKRNLPAWKAIAEPLSFRAEVRRNTVMIVGTVASRPFELDRLNCITYGLGSELGMRVSVEDKSARLLVVTREESALWKACARDPALTYGELQPPTGDAEFDAVFCVFANASGQIPAARLGPAERRLLVDFPQMEILQSGGCAWIHFKHYELQASCIQAAHRLLSSLIAEPEQRA